MNEGGNGGSRRSTRWRREKEGGQISFNPGQGHPQRTVSVKCKGVERGGGGRVGEGKGKKVKGRKRKKERKK
jgi:hypothetical protein